MKSLLPLSSLTLVALVALVGAEPPAHAAPCRSNADCTMCRGCCGQQHVYRKGGPLPGRCRSGIQCSCTAPPAGGYAVPQPTCRKGRCVGVYPKRVSISAAQCKKAGLPAVTLTLYVSSTAGLSIRRLSGKRTYLTISGPPGGPMGLRLSVSKIAGRGARALRALVRQQVRQKPLTLAAKSATVQLGKTSYKALGYVAGASLARQAGCVVLVAPRAKKKPAIALRFWGPSRKGAKSVKAASAACATLLRGRWSALARGFSLKR